MPILTTVGLLQGGEISDASRGSFVDDVNTLLLNGSGGFLLGGLPDPAVFKGDGFLHTSFAVQPLQKHIETFPVWHQVFIDTMFRDVANALDVDGSTPLSPVLDYTLPFAAFGFPLKDLTLPQFAAGMAIPDPTFQTQFEFFFDVDPNDLTPQLLLDIAASIPLPSVPIPPIPPIPPLPADFAANIPNVGIPQLPMPNLQLPPIPPFAFNITLPLPAIGFLFCAVVKALPVIFATLLARAMGGELIEALSKGPPGLIGFVAAVVIDAILSCLGIELKNVLTFLAGFLVFVERLILMLVVVLLGVVFGEGLLIKVAAKALGLT